MTSNKLAALAAVVALTGTAAPALADNITVLIGHLPPMSFEDGTGREAEIITHVMARCDMTVTFNVQPFTRHWKAYEAGQGDAVATVPAGMPIDGAPSNVYIQFQNGVSALEDRGLDFAELDDLAGHSVIGFMGASTILPGLAEASTSFGRYEEVADQIRQSRMVFAGRADAVIGDGMIFAELNRSLRASGDTPGFDPNQPVRFQAIFAPSDYTMAFRNPDHQASFDQCLSAAQADGSIAAIDAKWVEKYRDSLGSQYLGH